MNGFDEDEEHNNNNNNNKSLDQYVLNKQISKKELISKLLW
jgi:hypothetical protein